MSGEQHSEESWTDGGECDAELGQPDVDGEWGEPIDSWEDFAGRLAEVLDCLQLGDSVRFFSPVDDQGRRGQCILRVSVRDRFWVTSSPADHPSAEIVDDVTILNRPHVVADSVAAVCRRTLQVPHPGLMTVRATGYVEKAIHLLGLPSPESVPAEGGANCDEAEMDLPLPLGDRYQVRAAFASVIAGVTGVRPNIDTDGDLSFETMGSYIYATCAEDPLLVHLWSVVVPQVRSRREAALTLSLCNRHEFWTQWVLKNDMVVQRTVIPAGPFVIRHMRHHLESFLLALHETKPDLQMMLDSDPEV